MFKSLRVFFIKMVRKMISLLILLPFLTVVSGVTLEADRHHALPSGWKVIGVSPPSTTFELAFAVKNTNLGALEKHLLGASTPLHPRYGQHLTNKEVSTAVYRHLHNTNTSGTCCFLSKIYCSSVLLPGIFQL